MPARIGRFGAASRPPQEECGGKRAVLPEQGVDEYGRRSEGRQVQDCWKAERADGKVQQGDRTERPDQISGKDRQQGQRCAKQDDRWRVAPFVVRQVWGEHCPLSGAVGIDVEKRVDVAIEGHTRPGPEIGEIPIGQAQRSQREAVLAESPKLRVVGDADGRAEGKDNSRDQYVPPAP